jgi:hypothetical protein
VAVRVNLEDKIISAVLKDKQVHVLLQANVDNMLRTHTDIWDFVKNYYEQNQASSNRTAFSIYGGRH